MKELLARTSNGKPVAELFIGVRLKSYTAYDSPRRSGVCFETDCSAFLYVWFDVVNLDGWEVSGALRVSVSDSVIAPQGAKRVVLEGDGLLISGVSMLVAEVEFAETLHKVDNGLALNCSNGDSVLLVSAPMAGAMDFGLNIGLTELDSEYCSDCYRTVDS